MKRKVRSIRLAFVDVRHRCIEFDIAGERWTSSLRANQKVDVTSGAGLRLCGRVTACSAGESWALSLRANQGHVCASLTLEGGDGATAGAGASHRAGHGSMRRKREGIGSEVAKGRRGTCPRKRHVGPPSFVQNFPAVSALLAICRTIFSLSCS
jgi:hypothetical protein